MDKSRTISRPKILKMFFKETGVGHALHDGMIGDGEECIIQNTIRHAEHNLRTPNQSKPFDVFTWTESKALFPTIRF